MFSLTLKKDIIGIALPPKKCNTLWLITLLHFSDSQDDRVAKWFIIFYQMSGDLLYIYIFIS